MDFDTTNRIVQMNGSHASYSVIVIEKCNVKIVNAIYAMVYTARYYGISIRKIKITLIRINLFFIKY